MSRLDAVVQDAAARVLRQLCEAVLSEGLASSALIARDQVEWTLENTRFRADGHRGAFGRYRLRPSSIELYRDGAWREAQIDDVLDALKLAKRAAKELSQDLHQTVRFANQVAAEIKPDFGRRRLSVGELETALIEGHPYHPCYKARSEFDAKTNRQYGPEWGNTFRLRGVMFSRRLIHKSLPCPAFWMKELGPQEWRRISAKMALRTATPEQYELLPMHPWQFEKMRTNTQFVNWQRAGDVVDLGEIGDLYYASQSLRTLINAEHPRRPHVKTAISLRNTSSMRVLDPHTVCVAPAISKWLSDVVASDPLFATRYPLVVLREYAGIIAGRDGQDDSNLDGHLAVIFRESPEGLGIHPKTLVPLNALSLTEPDGAPFVAPWIEAHGFEAWLDQLINVVVLPVWHMMVAHGIGLEAHGQNLMLRHEKGWPVGVVARDFHDALEYVPDLLSRPDLCPDLALIDPVFGRAKANEYHRMSSPEALRELVMDTLFVFNLTDLSHILSEHYGKAESQFWATVRTRLDTYAAEHGLQERQALFRPFDSVIRAESLFTRKIRSVSGELHHLVPNALSKEQEDTGCSF